MRLSARFLKISLVVLFGGIVVYYKLLLPYYQSQILSVQHTFKGIKSTLGEHSDGRDLRVLIVHGIGEHCIGYSDRLMRGILKELGAPAITPIDEQLGKLPSRIHERALAFIERYSDQMKLSDSSDIGLSKNLGLLADGIKSGGIALASQRIDGFNSPPNLALEEKAARVLQLFVKYGLIDSGCMRIPLPQSQGSDKFDAKSEHTARNNTCVALNRFASDEEHIKCYRLTLDFYGTDQLMRIARKHGEINLPDFPPERCPEDSPVPDDTSCAVIVTKELGFLYTRTLRLAQHDGTSRLVRFYELTWDPATRWAKHRYTSQDGAFNRDLFNDRLKARIVNNSISDAIMYLGSSRTLIQFPLLSALCMIVTDRLGGEAASPPKALAVADEFRCGQSDLVAADVESFAQANEVVIITHSLGTRILLDTLGLLAQLKSPTNFLAMLSGDLRLNHAHISPEDVDRIRMQLRSMHNALMGSLRKIFVMTNQVPLFEMASLAGPVIGQSRGLDFRDIGKDFDRFLEIRKEFASEPLQLVAFTDHNDLLSYSLRCWYQSQVLYESPAYLSIYNELLEDDPELDQPFSDAIKLCRPAYPDDESIAPAVQSLWQQVESERRFILSEVSIQIHGARLPSIAADPAGVHSNYFDDDLVNRLIVCGANEGTEAPGPCLGGSAGDSR